MMFTVYAESLSLLQQAVKSKCEGIRFGSEFCETKLPSLKTLKHAFDDVQKAGKTFTYVTPPCSNTNISKIRSHLTLLNAFGKIPVVIGDLGTLNILHDFPNLQPHLGRPRVYMPARCPWNQITRMPNPSFFTRRRVERIFYQTSLNYQRAREYYRDLGVRAVDVDWIPKCFPHFKPIMRSGFHLSVHTYGIPVAVTMRCHTARFLKETTPQHCTQPCQDQAFNIQQNELEQAFILHGNVVYRPVFHQPKDLKRLQKMGVEELVIPLGPLSQVSTTKEIDQTLTALIHGA
jgi:hypothetical protein